LYAKHTEFSLGKLNLKTHGQGMLGPKDLDIDGLGLLQRVNYFNRSLLLDMMGIFKFKKNQTGYFRLLKHIMFYFQFQFNKNFVGIFCINPLKIQSKWYSTTL